MIKMQYFGSIRFAAGKSQEECVISPDSTVYGLLQTLAQTHGKNFQNEIWDEGGESLRDDLMVTLNGAVMAHGDAGSTRPQPNDVLALYPIFPGGG